MEAVEPVLFPAGVRDVTVLQGVHTGYGAHPLYYLMATREIFLWT
jgi:hypothetical protein